MNSQHRLVAFIAVVVLVVASVVLYLLVATDQRPGGTPASGARLAAVTSEPHLVFRYTDTASDFYGRVAVVPLDDPTRRPTFTDVSCERVHAAGTTRVCVTAERGVVTGFEGQTLGADWSSRERWSLPGVPSRTRVSPDASLVATTVFVTGHSYAGAGFSTATEIRRVGGESYGNLETFTLLVGGREVRTADRNMWGVTFARDDRTFYATAASRGRAWLVVGDLENRTLTSVRENAECPSLAPDERKVAYKKQVGSSPTTWAVAVLDLESGQERVLGGTAGLDDQVAWQDDHFLLYGLPREGDPGATDVWRVPADGSAEPELFLPYAWSPAVVR